MGQPHPHPPVLLIVAAFSRHAAALDWAKLRVVRQWGPLALESPRFEFRETDYYQATMGAELRKTFFAPVLPIDPAELVGIKLLTNQWEEEYAAAHPGSEPRPLNLDPGYVTLAKLVLASTKDHAHRIYLDRGIYAEVTLHFSHGRWQGRDWTFADYRRDDYHAFFDQCREQVRRLRQELPG